MQGPSSREAVGAPAPESDAGAPLHVVVHGDGPEVLLVHGSAVDRGTWSLQVAGLRSRARLLTYDRRGSGASALPAERAFLSIPEHADDAAAVIRTHAAGGPVVVCGSSFGGIVVLELARRHPGLVRGALLIEPPLPPSDEIPPMEAGFLARFDQLTAESSGEQAAEFFLRAVLSDAAFARIPVPFRDRTKSQWRAIRRDICAMESYRVAYAGLGEVRTPVLLLGGERSAPFYRPALEALHRSLGNARLETMPSAGHMLHAEASRRFNDRLVSFVAEVSPPGA